MLGGFVEEAFVELEAERHGGRHQLGVFVAFVSGTAAGEGVTQFIYGDPLNGAGRGGQQKKGGKETQRHAARLASMRCERSFGSSDKVLTEGFSHECTRFSPSRGSAVTAKPVASGILLPESPW
jgi:hypothetical protein